MIRTRSFLSLVHRLMDRSKLRGIICDLLAGLGVFVLLSLIVVTGCGKSTVTAVNPGQLSPDLRFVSLDTDKPMRLSDFDEKIVVLEFWATWCAPCQESMATLQGYPEKFAEHADSIEWIAVSIDDSKEAARKHLKRKRWNETSNVWANPKGDNSEVLASFVGKGIPQLCIIDRGGRIESYGHPNKLDVPFIVGELLK
jgi:thiol-disulfide isomerase/thioredoxin